MNFNTLWTTRFTMSQTGYLSTEVWFVQDQDEPRTSTVTNKKTRLLAEEQRANQKSEIEFIGQDEGVFKGLRVKAINQNDVLELVAYAAGLWIFLSFSIGHFSQKIAQSDPLDTVVTPHQGYDKVNETETEEALEKALDEILTEEQKEFIKSQQ